MPSERFIQKHPLVASLLIGLIVFFLITALRSFGALESLELTAYDTYLRLQHPVRADSRIVLITITEEDIQALGQWPLPDEIIAQLLEIVVSYKPRAVGLDIYRDIPVPPGRERLNSTLLDHNNIIVVEKFGGIDSIKVPPPQALEGSDQVGFNDIVVDADGIVRRGLLFLDDGQSFSYSFSLRLALLYLLQEEIVPQPSEANPEHLSIGKATFKPFEGNDGGYENADAGGYQILLDYKSGLFNKFTFGDTMAGKAGESEFRDKIVLIGITAQSVKDVFFVPFNRGVKSSDPIAGVTLHGHIISQYLRSAIDGAKPISSLSQKEEYIWILIWTVLGCVLGYLVRSPIRLALIAMGAVSIVGLLTFIALSYSLWAPSVPPALSFLASASLVTAYISSLEKAQRGELMKLFSKYVSKDVAEEIWKQRDTFFEGGRPKSQKLTATILFTDIKGFTSVSEKFEPQELMDWLNEYMEIMSDTVIENGGVVNKYIGDAIMAIFGVPLAREKESEIRADAISAVNCALAMKERLNKLNSQWQERGLPTIKMRVGIFTGSLVAGSLGGSERLEYTVIGDTVNTASRLESFDKELASESVCRILIGEPTLSYLDDQFQMDRVGEVSLKGKEKQVMVYMVTGRTI